MTYIGFSCVRINYRGSTGSGDNNVRCLVGRVGDLDIKDCVLATKTVKELYQVDEVLLYGGSYGGFIASHLAGRMPREFKAMVLRNPLINFVTKFRYADNPDGCATEAGFEYIEGGQEFEDTLLLLHRASPIIHSHNVIIPTAVMLGTKDKRVPYYQGLEFVRKLKAKGVPTR
ncbi:putative acylpeptide hydrolase [Danaus plexippus plexippus]|uniref:Acylpeptide hydrolase n=1 Tax=Danaus plexippus plexippus TaxID=278856 RepID=A0A212FIA2_DANPL|nr:putative acylpeptide hydrolase [Danaus plexippus plexippus]